MSTHDCPQHPEAREAEHEELKARREWTRLGVAAEKEDVIRQRGPARPLRITQRQLEVAAVVESTRSDEHPDGHYAVAAVLLNVSRAAVWEHMVKLRRARAAAGQG